MRTCYSLAVAIAFSLLLTFVSGDLLAGGISDKLDISGQIRYRSEADARDFNNDTDWHFYEYLRTRVNLHFNKDTWARVFVQIQDSRILGSPQSGNLANDANLGAHQAYMHLKDFLTEGLFVQYGRFEFVKGSQRLLGSVGWHNVGRSWDGSRFGYKNEDFSIEGFAFNAKEGTNLINDDVQFGGIYAELTEPRIDVFLVLDIDNSASLGDKYRMRRGTFGLYSERSCRQFFYNANLAFQFGYTDFDTRDISAWMATFEAGFKPQTDTPIKISAGVDLTSGDDGKDADKMKTFNNLYYTGHKFRGHMDFFVAQPYFGLNDYYAKLFIQPRKMVKLNGVLHIFRASVDFASSEDGSAARGLGSELDLFGSVKKDNVTLVVGFSGFFPSDDWLGSDADPSFWSYTQLIVGF